MSTEVLISIVIPVKNGDFWLEKLLDRLSTQTLADRSEIIVVDSGSTDRTMEILAGYPVRLIRIPPAEFNHGETRNLGAREAKGKYIVMTVQDACPADDHWLEYFIEGFIDDNVAGVCGQQVVPHELDKNPAIWYRPVSDHGKRFYHFESPDEFHRLSPADQREKAAWDNVTSAYRRDLLLQHPFDRIDFAEDICWAKQMLLKGYTLAHVDAAVTYHYHHHLPVFILPRYFSVYYFEYKLFKLRPMLKKPAFVRILMAGKLLLKEPGLSWGARMKWLFFNIRYWSAISGVIKRFNTALDKGESFLDKQYQEICKRPPQALKY